MLMLATGPVCPAAFTQGDLSPFEVAEEFFPFGVGGSAVFFAWAQGPAASDKGPVAVDCLLRVDRFISHGGIDVLVPEDKLGDMRWHTVQDGLGSKDPSSVRTRRVHRICVAILPGRS